MPQTDVKIAGEDYRICSKLLQRTIEGKVSWNYELAGQVWTAVGGIVFSLYFPDSELISNDHWRHFTVEENSDGQPLKTIFELYNPEDLMASTLGGRPASPEVIAALNELMTATIAEYSSNTYGRVEKVLDDL